VLLVQVGNLFGCSCSAQIGLTVVTREFGRLFSRLFNPAVNILVGYVAEFVRDEEGLS